MYVIGKDFPCLVWSCPNLVLQLVGPLGAQVTYRSCGSKSIVDGVLDHDDVTYHDEGYDYEGKEFGKFDLLFGSNEGDPERGFSEESVRRSSRKSSLPSKLKDYELQRKFKYGLSRYVNYAKLSFDNYSFVTNLNKAIERKTYKEASTDGKWIEAMNNEMEALNRNGTWEITDLPKGRKPLDVNNAFLYGDLVEDVYMYLLEGFFIHRDKKKLVGKLIYLTIIRPNISYAVHKLSQPMHGPLKSDLKLAFRVLRYLKGAPRIGVIYKASDGFELTTFVDSD
nr:ribonuclease H-like domain-containing protein [Tanacetum cinerariifolium]